MENVANGLNVFLADLNVFFRKLQNYHWYIEGEDFFVLHEKLEEYYEEVYKQIDEVAEHLLMMNCEPLATMKSYLQNATLVEAENKEVKKEEVFSVLINDFTHLMQEAKDIKKQADEKQIVETSSFIDEMISDFNKKIWMLKQTME